MSNQIATITSVIRTIRGKKVILAADLARIYGVTTKRLNEQVKRNANRFPSDFLFQLTKEEAETELHSRSQIATLKQGMNVKYLPYAFTENGAIMAANVLNSPEAVRMSVFVVRAFVQMRDLLGSTKELAKQLAALEKKLTARLNATTSSSTANVSTLRYSICISCYSGRSGKRFTHDMLGDSVRKTVELASRFKTEAAIEVR